MGRNGAVREEGAEAVVLAIKAIRENVLHISAAELSRRLGVHVQSVSRWENGREQPLARHYHKLLEMIGFDLSPASVVKPPSADDRMWTQLRSLHDQVADLASRGRTMSERIGSYPAAEEPFDRYVTLKEAAALRGVTRSAVDQWIRAEKIECFVQRDSGGVRRVVLRDQVMALPVKAR